MALSMDEQRMLAEIERRLAAEDPRLADSPVGFPPAEPDQCLPLRAGPHHRFPAHRRPRRDGLPDGVRDLALSLRLTDNRPPGNDGRLQCRAPASRRSVPVPARKRLRNTGENTVARAASGTTAQQSFASHASGAAVHRVDGPAGTAAHPASTAGQGP